MKEKEMLTVADFIHEALENREDPGLLEKIRLKVLDLNKEFPLP